MQRIDFYEPTGTYGALSNFYFAPIIIDGITYPTVEHYFQAEKFLGPSTTPRSLEYARLIARQSTPNKTKILANQKIKGGYKWVQDLNEIIRQYLDVGLRNDWEEVKDNVMRKGVYQKFKQHSRLRDLLLSTGEALLVEHTTRDAYWGDGGDNQGRNQLGRTLMEVRSLLRGGSPLILTGPIDRTGLNQAGVNFLVDLTVDHKLSRTILGQPTEEAVTIFPGPYVFVNGPQVDLTVAAIGKKYIVFTSNLDQEFITKVHQGVYGSL